MWKIATTSVFGALGLVGATGTARAQPTAYEETPGMSSYGWYEPRLQTGIGVGVILGGGISGFTDQSVRNQLSSSVAGMWEGRIAFGTHIPLGVEVAYLGQAVNLRTLDGIGNGTLLGTTVEGTLRINLMPHFLFNPYVFGGVGWQHYDVNDMRFATADTGIQSSEDIAEYPVGLGFAWRDPSGWTADLRGTFRAVPSSTLVRDPDGTTASLHWWEASAAVGYEF